MKSVYSAVRTASLNKAVCVSSVNRLTALAFAEQRRICFYSYHIWSRGANILGTLVEACSCVLTAGTRTDRVRTSPRQTYTDHRPNWKPVQFATQYLTHNSSPSNTQQLTVQHTTAHRPKHNSSLSNTQQLTVQHTTAYCPTHNSSLSNTTAHCPTHNGSLSNTQQLTVQHKTAHRPTHNSSPHFIIRHTRGKTSPQKRPRGPGGAEGV